MTPSSGRRASAACSRADVRFSRNSKASHCVFVFGCIFSSWNRVSFCRFVARRSHSLPSTISSLCLPSAGNAPQACRASRWMSVGRPEGGGDGWQLRQPLTPYWDRSDHLRVIFYLYVVTIARTLVHQSVKLRRWNLF